MKSEDEYKTNETEYLINLNTQAVYFFNNHKIVIP
jgi:hypothetical protein